MNSEEIWLYPKGDVTPLFSAFFHPQIVRVNVPIIRVVVSDLLSMLMSMIMIRISSMATWTIRTRVSYVKYECLVMLHVISPGSYAYEEWSRCRFSSLCLQRRWSLGETYLFGLWIQTNYCMWSYITSIISFSTVAAPSPIQSPTHTLMHTYSHPFIWFAMLIGECRLLVLSQSQKKFQLLKLTSRLRWVSNDPEFRLTSRMLALMEWENWEWFWRRKKRM